MYMIRNMYEQFQINNTTYNRSSVIFELWYKNVPLIFLISILYIKQIRSFYNVNAIFVLNLYWEPNDCNNVYFVSENILMKLKVNICTRV